MKKMQKQQVEGEELEPRKTGDSDLDRLLNEVAIMPLAISSDEMLRLIPKVETTTVARFRNIKWILTGVIALTGIVLYMLLSTKKDALEVQESSLSSDNNVSINLPSEPKLSVNDQNNILPNNKTISNTIKSTVPLKTNKSNINSIYLDGTTTVILNHDDRVVSIELNKVGVHKIIDTGVLISKEKFSDYSSDIESAYLQAGIKHNPNEKKNISKQEELAAAIIKSLLNENLLEDGESYDLSLTNKAAILNGKILSDENKTKMLTIVAQTTGKSLPNDGKIHIRH